MYTQINRRNFIQHSSFLSSIFANSAGFIPSLFAESDTLKKKNKSVIFLWMGGGPSTIDIWDLKPGSDNGGEFKPINTNVLGIEICEHLPMIAKNMDKLSIVRSMSTREADHNRGRYYMHTGYQPAQNIEHPSCGSIVSFLNKDTPQLDIPPFVSINGNSVGAGFLGQSYSPFIVNNQGQIKNLESSKDQREIIQRLGMLSIIENNFIAQNRGRISQDHANIIDKTQKLMFSPQMEAFKISKEPEKVKERYGNTNFGRSCLMARRLVEFGVPFIEIDFGGWDNHTDIFSTLKNQKLPEMDISMSALIEDLNDRGLLESTTIVWLGEFGRTPRINGNSGRDHWARSWSVVVGGGKFKSGIVVGQTDNDGVEVKTHPYTSQDLMASILHCLDINPKLNLTTPSGRPMPLANNGSLIKELF